MTNDQISALAREYAEEIFKNDESNPDLSICLLNDIKFEAAADFEEKLRFLLRRYCLVEKERVRREYDEARIFCENLDPCGENYAWNESKMRLLESLFPEIAKEVENEKD